MTPSQGRQIYDFIQEKCGSETQFVVLVPQENGSIQLNAGNLTNEGICKVVADTILQLAHSGFANAQELPPFKE
jgi:hypothetical protein